MPAAVRVHWFRFVHLLMARSQLSLDTAEALEQMAYCAQEVRELRKILTAQGRVVSQVTVSGENMLRAHPAQAMLADADRRLRGWLSEFGLTDASRSKVYIGGEAGPQAGDPLAEFGLSSTSQRH